MRITAEISGTPHGPEEGPFPGDPGNPLPEPNPYPAPGDE